MNELDKLNELASECLENAVGAFDEANKCDELNKKDHYILEGIANLTYAIHINTMYTKQFLAGIDGWLKETVAESKED